MGKVAVDQKKNVTQPKMPLGVLYSGSLPEDAAKIINDALPTRPSHGKRAKSYKVEDVLRLGKPAFLRRVSPKEPLQVPDLDFTPEEKRMMDEALEQSVVEE